VTTEFGRSYEGGEEVYEVGPIYCDCESSLVAVEKEKKKVSG
jgi:hypothetical protein